MCLVYKFNSAIRTLQGKVKCDSTQKSAARLDQTHLRCSPFHVSLLYAGSLKSCKMQDLVQMMTQTLRMDTEDINKAAKSIFGLAALPEFKLNQKYRDTLVLHGRSREEAEDLSLAQIPPGGVFNHH